MPYLSAMRASLVLYGSVSHKATKAKRLPVPLVCSTSTLGDFMTKPTVLGSSRLAASIWPEIKAWVRAAASGM